MKNIIKSLLLRVIIGFGIYKLLLKYYYPYSVRVLCYHSISDDHKFLPKWLQIDTETFEKHIILLKRYFNIVTFEDLQKLESKRIKNPLVITFDDGLIDNFNTAFPLLKKHNTKAVFFLTTLPLVDETSLLRMHSLYTLFNQIGFDAIVNELLNNETNLIKPKNMVELFCIIKESFNNFDFETKIDKVYRKYNPATTNEDIYMKQSQVLSLIDNGMEIGSHGYSHFPSNKITDLSIEGIQSKQLLEEICGKNIISFAYPFGDKGSYNNHTNAYFGKLFNYICTTTLGINNQTGSKLYNRTFAENIDENIMLYKLLFGK